MSRLFEVKDIDTRFYQEKLQGFLPERIIDIHTHVWLDEFRISRNEASGRTVTWPSRVAKDNPIDDLIETYKLLLPDKNVIAAIFSNIGPGDDIDAANHYVAQCAEKLSWPAFLFSTPKWSAEEFEKNMLTGKFSGTKAYLSMSETYIPSEEVRIFDFLPHHQLEVLNQHGWIVMLHIPRLARLKDPVNLAQMLEIERRYPKIKLIIAHVGRAYCNEDIGDAFDVLADTQRMMFDFSANTNAFVFEQLIKAVGAERILFGSDMPITRMRMSRISENGRYINLVPKGLYGDVSGDDNMREVKGRDAENLTFFLYEELDAFRRASEQLGLSPPDISRIFFDNASDLIHSVNQ